MVLRRLALVVATTVAFAAGANTASAAGSAFVRVDQVGYPTAATKIAYVIASASEGTSAAFDVIGGNGSSVLHRALPPSSGSWNSAFPDVYRLDLSAITTPGTYHIHVAGALPASSPTFAIAAPAALYAQPLIDARTFYEDQRDGPNVISGPLGRGPTHTLEAQATVYLPPTYTDAAHDHVTAAPTAVAGAAKIDVSGGWLDAGDDLKFTGNEAFAELTMLLAMADYPSAFQTGATNLLAEARFGMDYLLKTWDDSSRTLYYQVGLDTGTADGSVLGDHDIWRRPEQDDTISVTGPSDPKWFIKHFPAFRAGPPGSPIDPITGGRLAAAFAACSRVFRSSDPTYADRCLLDGQRLYELLKTDPPPAALATRGAPQDWQDDMELAASELALATAAATPSPLALPHPQAAYYVTDSKRGAIGWADQYIATTAAYAPFRDTLANDDVSALAHIELLRTLALPGLTGVPSNERQKLLADIKNQLDFATMWRDQAYGGAPTEPFGLGVPYDNGVAPRLPGLALTAELYDDLTQTGTYAPFAQSQLDYLFGANPWGMSFMVGAGTTYPHCLQSQIQNSEPGSTVQGGTGQLLGALVTGPVPTVIGGLQQGMTECIVQGFSQFDLPASPSRPQADYRDDVGDWASNEPDIAYTAFVFMALAHQIPGASNPLPPPASGGGGGGGGTTGGGGGGTASTPPQTSGSTQTAALLPTVAQIAAALRGELAPRGAKRARVLRAGGFTYSFSAPAAGIAAIGWYQVPRGAQLARKRKPRPVLVATGARTFATATTAPLRVALTPAGKRLLRHSRRVKLTAKGSFVAAGVAPVSVNRAFTL